MALGGGVPVTLSGQCRAGLVADAGAAVRAFRPAFFFISADDSGTVLEGTIILGARSALFG
jgi:hypothetical protein